MEAAAAKSERKTAAALPPAVAVTMCALSVLFAWLAARALRCPGAADEQEAALSLSTVLWRLSPLICAYLSIWTVALREARSAAVFARASFLLLLADAAARHVGPHAGASAMFVATAYSASTSGRALADRRLRAGTERYADAAALSAPRYRSRLENEYERSHRFGVVLCMVFVVGTIALVMSLDSWLMPENETAALHQGKAHLFTLVVFSGPGLLIARMLLLHGGPFDPDVPDACWVAIVAGVFGWVVVAVYVGVFFGEVAAMVFVWVVVMAMAGLFGYGQGVRSRYEQLVAIKRSQPRTALDASGLLVGRDKEDACYARII